MWQTVVVVAGFLGACVAASPTPLENNAWALLVAGSNTYMNYRHQADVCHSYHIMINEGIPAENIIVMMYDDIAYNTENPTPGVIINRPNGTNVYAGVKIDYKGDDVAPQNFLNILSGKKKAMQGIGTGRVIKSDENTNIFVYFADHGGTGMLCFPNSDLMAHELENTLSSMRRKKQFNKFIFYVEACESGSMFDSLLPEHADIYVMTAAARDESSYAYYCEGSVCLGDEFSVKWMEHMDLEKTGTLETFFHQYQYIRSTVEKSHVQIYGDFSLGPDELTPNKDKPTFVETGPGDVVSASKIDVSSVSSRDVVLHYQRKKIARFNDLVHQQEAQRALDQLIEARKMGDQLFEEFVIAATQNSPKLRSAITEDRLTLRKDIFPCYEKLINHFRSHCFDRKHEYFLQHFYKFSNMCLLNADVKTLQRQMSSICKTHIQATKVTVM